MSEKGKKRYEPPRLIELDLDPLQAMGQTLCSVGRKAGGQCLPGSKAQTVCNTGSAALRGCGIGNRAASGCRAGIRAM